MTTPPIDLVNYQADANTVLFEEDEAIEIEEASRPPLADTEMEQVKTPVEAEKIEHTYPINEKDIGERIDKVATTAFHDYSREQIKQWLSEGELTVNDQTIKPKYRLKSGDVVSLTATQTSQQEDIAEAIALDIVYEDDAVLVINKPVGMVVHPGAGNPTGTLVNALLYHYPASRLLPRAGLVHRIDKDTSGLLVVAKDSQSQLDLINQLKDKTVYRHYQALVLGNPSELKQHRTIDAPIGRHATQRTKMAVTSNGKPAITHLDKVQAIREGVSLVSVRLETGRTHQIRVHLSNLGFALLGDPVYGSSRKTAILMHQLNDEQKHQLSIFQRQALHAYELGFRHPKTQALLKLQAPLAADMQALITSLQTS